MDDPTSAKAEENRKLARAQREVICEMLGLNIRETSSVTIEFGSGMTLVRWEGARRLNARDTTTALAQIAAVEVSSDG